MPGNVELSGRPNSRLDGTLRRKLPLPVTCGIVDVVRAEEKDVPVGMLVPHRSRAVTTASGIVRMVVAMIEKPTTRAWEDGWVSLCECRCSSVGDLGATDSQ